MDTHQKGPCRPHRGCARPQSGASIADSPANGCRSNNRQFPPWGDLYAAVQCRKKHRDGTEETLMATQAPRQDPTDRDLSVGEAKTWAAGVPAVAHSLRIAQQQMGVQRTALT